MSLKEKIQYVIFAVYRLLTYLGAYIILIVIHFIKMLCMSKKGA